MAAYIYYYTVRYSIVARINLSKNPHGEANKSANRWGNLRAKGGVGTPSTPSVYMYLALLVCGSNMYIPLTRLRCLFLLATISSSCFYLRINKKDDI